MSFGAFAQIGFRCQVSGFRIKSQQDAAYNLAAGVTVVYFSAQLHYATPKFNFFGESINFLMVNAFLVNPSACSSLTPET
jgi:hypothetical protein